MQAAVTPDLNMQVEWRHRKSEQGDLAFNFDPETFNPDLTDSLDVETARAGLRYSPSPNSNLLMSYVHVDQSTQSIFDPSFQSSADQLGTQVESQYIYTGEWFNLVAGGGNTDIDLAFLATGIAPFSEDIKHLHGYIYTNVKVPQHITWTLGASYDDFEHEVVKVKRTNPKIGVRWDITSNLSVRAAAFQWVKPPLLADRTLEPTQVSGFNQFFDNSNGDKARNRGVGIDWRLTKQFFAGAEATWRDIDVPITVSVGNVDTAVFEAWKEQLHRAYLFWAPTLQLSLSGQVVYDTFEFRGGPADELFSSPVEREHSSAFP